MITQLGLVYSELVAKNSGRSALANLILAANLAMVAIVSK
jgi:hypothetical protein